MSVSLSFDRRAVEIQWDTEIVKGDTVDIRTESADDVSGRADVANDGRATLTFPYAFTGSTHVTVTGSDEGVDEGDISV